MALLADLARAFPRNPITPETLRVYLRELDDVPPELLEAVVRDLIRTSEWFPTVRAIRERAAERSLGLPAEAEALAQIEARIRWARTSAAAEAPPIHPVVLEAIRGVGGFHAFRSADEASVIRGQFGRLYRELRGSAIAAVQTGALALPSAPTGRELRS